MLIRKGKGKGSDMGSDNKDKEMSECADNRESIGTDSGKNHKKEKGTMFWLIMLTVSTVALITCAAIAAELFHLGLYDSTVEFRKKVDNRLLQSYAVKALSEYQNDFGQSEFQNTNFEYAVYSTDEPENVDLSKRSSYLVCTLDDETLSGDMNSLFKYSATIGKYTSFNFNTQNIWNCYGYIRNSERYEERGRLGEAKEIDKIVYVWNTNQIYVIADDYYFQLHASIEDAEIVSSDFSLYLNSSKNGWNSNATGKSVILDSGSGNQFFVDIKKVQVCEAEVLSDYNSGETLPYSFVELETWNVWIDNVSKTSGTDYYLIAKVADQINYSYDDLFTRSIGLVDAICSLRYAPIIVGAILTVLWLFCLIRFLKEFMKTIKRAYISLSSQWRGNVSLLWRAIGLCAAFAIIEFFFICIDPDFIYFFFIIDHLIIISAFILLALQLRKITDGATKLASGDIERGIDTTHMFYDFKKIGDSINLTRDGLEKAVDERLKSERLKTELISNVSHDIKTPLTSIISYVELLSKQPEGEPVDKEYLEALERQSIKLKKLLEDLIEASKASTGNLKVDLETCDVNMVLDQVIGEYEEKLTACQLDLRIKGTEETINIHADTKHLQRVLDNILINIAKYAQPGTRAYVDLKTVDDNVLIEFKNTSRDPLNVSSDELLQRFVRGDAARNSEGNGLGLSIAKSLMELMNGKLELYIDGDLFKVVLIFPQCK